MQFESDQIPLAPPMRDVVVQPQSAAAFCKFHPHAAAQFFCPKCRKTFCDLCVNLRQGRHFCRACGVECSQLKASSAQTAPEKSFFSQACGAFGYPLKGDGKILLICGGGLFLLIDGATFVAKFAFIYGLIAVIFLTVFGIGYMTRFLQNIVVGSAHGDNEMPDWPDVTDYSSEVTTPFFQSLGLVIFCFAPAIGLTIYAAFAVQGGAWLGWAVTASIFFGAIYFPMAFAAVAMFDSLAAVNPLLVVPAILKIPKEYALAIVLFIVILILRWLGEKVLPDLLGIPYILPSIVANFFGLYLLAVETRILGLLCLTKKDELGWLGR
jgi:hypothetical protein